MDLLFSSLIRTTAMQPVLEQCGYDIKPALFLESGIKCCLADASSLTQEDMEETVNRVFEWERFKNDLRTCVIKDEMTESMQKRFDYVYPYQNLQNLYTKTSVSELKMAAIHDQEQEGEAKLFEEEIPLPYLPSFLKGEEKVSGTLRGSAMHRMMELLDLQIDYTTESLKAYTLEMVQSGKM